MVRLAIKAGVEPMTAIQMATINSAEAYRIDDKVGSICPGRIADILFVEDLENFEVKEVMTMVRWWQKITSLLMIFRLRREVLY